MDNLNIEEAYLESLIKMRATKDYDLFKIIIEDEIEKTRSKIKEMKNG